MFAVFKKLKALLNKQERRRVQLLFFLMLATAFVEVVGVASIMPFVAVLANPEVVESNAYLAKAYQWSGLADTRTFMFLLAGCVLVVFVVSLALKALNTYAIMRFTNMRAHAFSYRLLTGYMARPYSFFLGRNTADLSKTLFSEVNEVIGGVLIPSLKLVSGVVVAAMMLGLLLMADPMLTVIAAVVLGGAFVVIYASSRAYLKRLGKLRVEVNKQRFVMANEALNGIKELRLMGREQNYLVRFADASERYANYQSINKVFADIPHFGIQAVAFGGILVLVMYLMSVHGGLQEALPVIALFAFAGYRMLPAFQEIFKNSTQLRFYGAALDSLHADLSEAPAQLAKPRLQSGLGLPRLSGDICLDAVTYCYPEVAKPAIKNLSLTIAKGSSIAFVGSTGAGKSTAVDLVLGLLEPQSGELRVAGQALRSEALQAWQRNIGYVPQSIYLADASLAENIAFGIPAQLVDMVAVERAARAAHIHEFISEQLPQGYDTSVGERGVRLSGGQRQRIGIARALYHDPEVVVFDEATSALDNATEAAVMEAINELAGHKTIILIAHRLTTVQHCDAVYMLDKGELVAQGTYESLIAGSGEFSRLVNA
ncbi:ABC transporter ATP-binding protein [Pseudomonas xionganensis]|uniref:ATP-binding cassette domain-containing protein n=1 Tax=Pseudomonas xionganensis TaxID=2654845 RepID=A0A6I4L042_9PSED|nr:ATP-binding cassette domain-containing protein [Pseudomonas xionganensis]MVW76096.1 ATP-binding cassette domain-containing protein [Pseudomonas xionganensis]